MFWLFDLILSVKEAELVFFFINSFLLTKGEEMEFITKVKLYLISVT